MAAIQLRDYQAAAIDGLRQGFREGLTSLLLSAPTGAGKTVIGSQLLHDALNRKDREGNAAPTPTAFMVDRVVLVDQTSRTLDRYGIPHGIIQAGHWRYRPNEPIQICSAQTIEKRGFFPGCRLLINDECHVTRAATSELIANRDKIGLKVVGLSATPFTKGLADLYQRVVNVTTTRRLQADGHLCNLVAYAAKAIDMDGAKTVAGEWSDKEATARGLKIVGDVLNEWVEKTTEHFGGPVKTIVFAASVAHGEEVCRQFQDAGYNFHQISYKDTSDERRRALIDEFSKPDSEIMGLVACEVLTKGFDVPDVLCGIAARPYRKSLSSHIQQIGRVLRTAPGKEFALWLDHSGNYLRFYDDTEKFFEEGVEGLDDGRLQDTKPREEPTEEEREARKCPNPTCHAIIPRPRPDNCPKCGAKLSVLRNLIEVVEGKMVMIGGKPVPVTPENAWLADRASVWRQIAYIAQAKKAGNETEINRMAQAIYRKIYGDFYMGKASQARPLEPCAELAQRVHEDAINFKRRQSYARQSERRRAA